MERVPHLRLLLALGSFRRLLTTRLAGQFGDGVFQASLAGAVLFNPERQAHAADVAAGFAVLLLPYSLIGPFAGVLLDRWWRQRILSRTNVVRAGMAVVVAASIFGGLHGQPLFALALVVISLSRFVLAALSAALPHVVTGTELPTANSLSTTAGAIATTLGGAVAIGVRALIGDDDHAYAIVAAGSALCYLAAAFAARGFARAALGPDDRERAERRTTVDVAHGLVDGARHVRSRPAPFAALCVIGVQRLGYGVITVCTLLLYRNYFTNDGFFRAGLGGLAQVVVAVAIGGFVAAVVTPPVVRRIGLSRWAVLLLLVAAATLLVLVLPFRLPLVLAAALVLGLCSQGIKISVDTTVQRGIDDAYRGRVFALYDALFNVALVLAAVLTAVALPESGRSPAATIVIAAGWIVTAAVYLRNPQIRVSSAHPSDTTHPNLRGHDV